MRTVLLLARKDLLQRLRDRSFIVLGIVAPLVVAWVLATVSGPAFDPTFEGAYLVHDPSGVVGPPLVEALSDAGLRAETAPDAASAREAVDTGAVDAAILIPAPGTDPSVVAVYGSRADGLALAVGEAIGQSVATTVDTARIVMVAGGPTALPGLGQVTPPVVVTDSEAGTRVLDGATYLSVGISLFFLFFTVQGSILNIVEERTNGTLQRLLMAPTGRGSILLGKTLSSAVTGLVSMAVLVVATTLLLGADWGPWPGVALLSAAAVVAAMGIGALIGTVTRTAEQAGQFAGIVATVLGLLGGVFFPITSGPGAFDTLTRISPHRWLIDGFGANAGAGSLGEVAAIALVVVLFGVVTGIGAFTRRSSLTGVV